MRVQIDMTVPRALPEDAHEEEATTTPAPNGERRGASWMTQWTKYFSRFERSQRKGGFACKEPMQKIPPDKNCRFCGLMRRIHEEAPTATTTQVHKSVG